MSCGLTLSIFLEDELALVIIIVILTSPAVLSSLSCEVTTVNSSVFGGTGGMRGNECTSG